MNNLLSIQSFLRIDYKILIVLIILIFSFIVEPRLFVNGIFLGLILGVGSMGLTLSYGITKFANIAHGDFMTFGAYISYFVLEQFFPSTNGFGPFSFGGSLLLALPISTVIVAIFYPLRSWRYIERHTRFTVRIVVSSPSPYLFLTKLLNFSLILLIV